MSRIRWFSDLSMDDIGQVGGKNASLGELVQGLVPLGVRVPDGFATTADAYRELLAENGLDAVVRQDILKEVVRAVADEGERVLAALPKSCWCVALDGRGKPYRSEQLAERMEFWRGCGRDPTFLIGGPEGHSAAVLERADERWSLGPLTLPHPLVRVVLLEQLYRAASMLANHPYHRG